MSESAERVEVQDDERQRQHHDAPLRDQGEGEQADRRREPPAPTLLVSVDGLEVHQDREQEEQPGKHVTPFGRPTDGLGAERVEDEEQRRRNR